MKTSKSQSPPLDKMISSVFGFERGTDPFHADAFPPEFRDYGNQGQPIEGWMVLDYWGTAIGFIPDGTEYEDVQE